MLHKIYNLITYIILPLSILMCGIRLAKTNSPESVAIATAVGWDTYSTEQTLLFFGLVAVFIALLLLKKWWYNH